MPYKEIKGFKGLAQHIDKAQLPPEYAVTMRNLDVDNPVGQLKLRQGYTTWKATAFTSLISAFEFTVESSGSVITVVNDNGTLEYFKDGTYIGTLTLPTVGGIASTIDTGFTNNYFPWRDAVRITTGAGSTNHVLWFGYTKRLTSANDGLFGDVLNDDGTTTPRLLRSQLVPDNGGGNLAQIRKIVNCGSYMFCAYYGTKWIGRMDSKYNLLSLHDPVSIANNHDLTDDYTSCECSVGSDGTYVYVSYGNNAATGQYVTKRDPDTWEELATSADITMGNGNITDITVAGGAVALVAIVKQDGLELLETSDLTNAYGPTTTDMASCFAVGIDTNNVYTGNNRTVQKRALSAIQTVTGTSANIGASGEVVINIHALSATLYCNMITRHTGGITPLERGGAFNNAVTTITISTMATAGTTTLTEQASNVYVDTYGGSDLKVISYKYGTVHDYSDAAATRPNLVAIGLDAGIYRTNGGPTYFYKYSLVDVDGQEGVLSEAARFTNVRTTSGYVGITLSAMEKDVAQFYRVRTIRIYRAYSATEDAITPDTNYKFFLDVDVNLPKERYPGATFRSAGWVYDTTSDVYYIQIDDDTSEDIISTTTFENNSGFSENVKPRYVNGKYFTWLGNQLHLANVYSDGNKDSGETFKSHIVRSMVNSPDVMPLYDIFKYDDHGGEAIKGLANVYGRAIAFKAREIGIFYNGVKEHSIAIGVSSDKAFVKHNKTIYFANANGIYKLEGTIATKISDPVITELEGGVLDHTTGALYYVEDKDILFATYSSSGDCTLVHNTKYNTWTKYIGGTGVWTFKGFYRNSDGDHIAIGSTLLYKLYSGVTDVTADIQVYYESGVINFEPTGFDNEIISLNRKMSIVTETSTSSFTIYEYTGNGRTALTPVITMNDSSSTFPNAITDFLNDVWGESISFIITGWVSQFQLSRITFKYNVLGETVNVV